MFPFTILPLLPAHPAMLLVLLPAVGPGPLEATPLVRSGTNQLLRDLQLELGNAIHVLKVDEGTHPAVVRAFDGRGVPAFVLLRDGEELWRQQGLPEGEPEGEPLAALLLSKLAEVTPPAV